VGDPVYAAGLNEIRVAPITLVNTDLVIFDCDGVLIDSEIIASRTMAEALGEFGVSMTQSEAHVTFTGNSEQDTRTYCTEVLGISDLDGLFSTWWKRLYEGFKVIEEIEGIAEVVTNLNRPVCVASNSSLFRLTRSLGRVGLWRAFHGNVFSADHVARPKPAPDLLWHCATEMGADPSRCVMIDDSPHGVESAVAAGMVAIGFVDLRDPRPGRIGVLREAGAVLVASGSAELRSCLEQADLILGAAASHGQVEQRTSR
jgi:HAD superfamily hydrolase (TIGR01509 family)